MLTPRTLLRRCALCLTATFGLSVGIFANAADDAANLGTDYAFLFLMTLSPDFAAANYTISNEGGSDVDITIARLPFHFDLMATKTRKLQLEVALAYQQTREVIATFPAPGENIDSKWTTYGGGLGLIYEQELTEHLRFRPSLRAGVARMDNRATYNGVLTNSIKDQLEGTLLNWETNASVINLGLGLGYDWSLRDRTSSIKADAYHVYVDSFGESNAAVKFTERANMLALKADIIFPTNFAVAEKRLDLVLLLGTNSFFGENRRTLGYTTSYQLGVGSELPLSWEDRQHGHIRLSGQVLWADIMRGWLITVGYNPD